MLERVSKITENEAKKQKFGFISMLFGTLGPSLLGNLLTSKGMKAKIIGRGLTRAGGGAVTASQGRVMKYKNLIKLSLYLFF